jgi:hypothetical protein
MVGQQGGFVALRASSCPFVFLPKTKGHGHLFVPWPISENMKKAIRVADGFNVHVPERLASVSSSPGHEKASEDARGYPGEVNEL